MIICYWHGQLNEKFKHDKIFSIILFKHIFWFRSQFFSQFLRVSLVKPTTTIRISPKFNRLIRCWGWWVRGEGVSSATLTLNLNLGVIRIVVIDFTKLTLKKWEKNVNEMKRYAWIKWYWILYHAWIFHLIDRINQK